MESVNKGYGKIGTGWNDIKECYVKQNGLWVKHPSVYVKRNDDWYKITFAQLPPGVICVSPFGDGDGTGRNWSNAMSFIQFTVRAPLTEDTVYFFKKGCYALNLNIPTTGNFENYIYKGSPMVYGGRNETASIQMANNISIYGGFEGDDAEPMKRHDMFAGTAYRTVFFKMYVSSGGIGGLFKRPLSNGSSKFTIDNVDLRGYGSTYCYIFGDETLPGTTAVEHNISRVSTNSFLTGGLTFDTTAEPAPQSNITFNSCLVFGLDFVSPLLGVKNINVKIINCHYSRPGANYSNLMRIQAQDLAASEVSKAYIINSTILRGYTSLPGLCAGTSGEYSKLSATPYVIPQVINSLDINTALADGSFVYKNGLYDTPSGNIWYDNFKNSISFKPGTGFAGTPYTKNSVGLDTVKTWGDLMTTADKSITAFVSNEDALAAMSGVSIAITPAADISYPAGAVISTEDNTSVPTVDITGYSRPSGVMTLGAWHYR